MKLTLRVGAAIGIIGLAGCSQSSPDNYAETTDTNASFANEAGTVPAENATETDTLGNQMNQLNESGMNMSDAQAVNTTGNMTNGN